MSKLSFAFILSSTLSFSAIALAGNQYGTVCAQQSSCSMSLDEAIAVKESFEPSFFAIPGIHSVGITLCNMQPVVVSSQKYCITVAGEDQFSFDSFVYMFPKLEVGGLPIKLSISEMPVAQPGVVVAD
jgi:hypothetical protein